MAYADHTTGGRTILQGIGPVEIALSEACEVGDLLGSSANTWKRADGNARIYAELIAGEAGANGDTIRAYRIARVGGVSGATKGKPLYLADAAGETVEAPGTVLQMVGFALSATEILLEPHDTPMGLVQGEKHVIVSANKTLALADCDIVQIVDTDAKLVTLPATADGLHFIIMNGGADAAVLVAIDPNSADKISGAGLSPVDNKDLQNTKATAKFGDYVELIGGDANGYTVIKMRGTWTIEA